LFGITEKIYVVEYNTQINHKNTKKFYKDMEFVRKHKKFAKGVVVRLNCPGGSPSLSFEIAEYLKKFKKDIPVHIYVESMAASGGYFIAASGDKIYSNPYAIVGSIGVIMQKVEISGLAEKVGVQEDNLSVGNFKQPLSLFKPVDEDGEEYLKSQLMNPTYELFVDYVATNRGIDKETVKAEYADGRIFVASETVGKLVDELITFHQLLENLTESEDFMDSVQFVDTTTKTFREKLGFTLNINIPQLKNDTGLSLS
jgi:protease-4